MARKEKNTTVLTTSGYEYDKDLSRVSIKVIPALQALIANQHELTETLSKHLPEKKLFVDMHLSELSIVEETIAEAYSKYRLRKEESKKLRQEKEVIDNDSSLPAPGYDEPLKETEVLLDEMAAQMSPGLPSQRLSPESKPPRPNEDRDVRRIAIGASIKALSNLLGRQLTDKEIMVIEKQVDSYL